MNAIAHPIDLKRALPAAIIVCLFLAQAALRFQSDLVGDASWYLYVADGLLHGKQMYVDYLEVNPPLAVWIMVPVAWLGSAMPLGLINALYVCLLALTAASLALVNRYLRLLSTLSREDRHWLCALIVAITLFLPAGDFGEREHFMVLLFMPWVFLRLSRHHGARPPIAEAVAVGVVAAVAICFKPQSVLAPLAVELFLLWKFRHWQALFAPENLAAGAFAIAYGTVLFVAEPEFMNLIINLGIKAYMPFYGLPAEIIWFGGLLSATLIALALVLWWQSDGTLSDVAAVCAFCAAGFLASYFIQYKGFSYQVLPALAFASVACGTGSRTVISQAPGMWTLPRKFLIGAAAALAILHLGTTRQACVCDERITASTISTYAPEAKSVFIASIRVGAAFPLVVKLNLVWASRLPTSWLTPYVATKWQEGPLPPDDIISHALDWAVSDLATFQPEIVFVDESTEQLQVKTGYFDYVKFWMNDPRFAPLWEKYERRATVNDFAIYTLK